MTTSHRMCIVLALCVAAVGSTPAAQRSAVPLAPPAARDTSPTLEGLFSRYRAGDFVGVQQTLHGAGVDFPSLVAQVKAFAAGHAHDQAASAFLLEVAEAHFFHGTRISPFFEVACGIARSGPAGTPFDLAWQLASLSLAEGRNAGDDFGSAPPYTGAVRYADVYEHISHVAGRGIDAGTVALAKAIFQEQRARNALLVIRSFSDPAPASPSGPTPIGKPYLQFQKRNPNLSEALTEIGKGIGLYSDAAKYEDVKAEAVLRGSFLRSFLAENDVALGVGWDDGILDALASVKTLTSERRLVFLAELFSGRYLEARGRLNEAAKAYGDAAAMFPAAFSARLGLMSTSYALGQPLTAGKLSDSVAGTEDPWVDYRYGDYRLWNQRLNTLRAEVRRLAPR